MAAPKTNRPPKTNPTAVENLEAAPAPCTLATDASPSSPDVLRSLYAALLKTRMLEEQVLDLLRAGKISGAPYPFLAARPPRSEPASAFSLTTAWLRRSLCWQRTWSAALRLSQSSRAR